MLQGLKRRRVMNLKFDCGAVSIEPVGGDQVRVGMTEIDNYDLNDQAEKILDEMDKETILKEVDEGDMLDHIGIEAISEHVDLDEFFDHNEEDLIALMEGRGFKLVRP